MIATITLTTIPSANPVATAAGAVQIGHGGSSRRRSLCVGVAGGDGRAVEEALCDGASGGGVLGISLTSG
jgi:hypothetical protein